MRKLDFNAINENIVYTVENEPILPRDVVLDEGFLLNKEIKNTNSLICSICLGIARTKTTTCSECEKAFCNKCIDEHLLKSQFCPCCRKKFIKKNCKYLNQLLESLLFTCPLKCGESVGYNEIEKHFQICENNRKKYKCSLCGKVLEEPGNHNASCPEVQFTCLCCQRFLKRKDIAEHEEECPKRMVKCNQCRIGYPPELKNSHDQYYCQYISSLIKLTERFLNII